MEYNRKAAVEYAKEWAFLRNPKYYDFENIGGDCTNFASQCLYAGSGVMNFRPVLGWYYLGPNNRSPSWTGVKYFYNFLTANKDSGPFGFDANKEQVEPADFVQLFRGGTFTHTLIITKIENGIFVASHSLDSFNRPLSTYEAQGVVFIHIEGVRTY